MRFRVFMLLILSVLLGGCGLFSNPDKRIFFGISGSEPNEHERLYYHVAGAIASEKPCYLISPDAYTVAPGVAPLNMSGNVVRLHRSACFENAAILSKREELCDKVKTASTLLYSGTGLHADRCRQEVSKQQRVSGNIIETEGIAEFAGITGSELAGAMIDLRIFPNPEITEAYREERPDQFKRCAERYVIYSKLFFHKIDQFPNYAGSDAHEQLKHSEWREHPYISVPGFTQCFLSDGAARWADYGVSRSGQRKAPGTQFRTH